MSGSTKSPGTVSAVVILADAVLMLMNVAGDFMPAVNAVAWDVVLLLDDLFVAPFCVLELSTPPDLSLVSVFCARATRFRFLDGVVVVLVDASVVAVMGSRLGVTVRSGSCSHWRIKRRDH